MNNKKISLASLLALSVLISGCQMVLALDATGESVEEAVRKAQVIKKDYPVHAVISGREATILTRRHPKATDDDLRIDAVLITKSVLDSFNTIGTVQVLFRDEDSSSGKSVEVTAGDIKTYANGTIDPKKFLATIAVTKVGGDEEATRSKLSAEEKKFSVSPGLYEEQRLLLMDRINTLRRKGTGVAPFEAMFAQIEAQTKSGQNAALKDSIHKLGEKLAAQEDLVRQANRTGSGRGISVVSSSKISSQSSSQNQNSDRAASTPLLAAPADPIDAQNQQLFATIKSELAQHRGNPGFGVYYLRKLSDIAEEKVKGGSSARINSLLSSLAEEMQRQPDYRNNFKGGRGMGPNQQGGPPGPNQGFGPGGGSN
ncbi:hypothetical protein KBI23_21635 [bacterium]|nr:hypothetical protein [bacterium]MBP9810986.1 hypothetical protein [bacterium]